MKVVQMAFLFSLLYHGISFAEHDVTIVGTIPHPININQHSTSFLADAKTSQHIQREIRFLNVKLSSKKADRLAGMAEQLRSSSLLPSQSQESSNKKVYLGMNGVPVLDQGAHGSCVVFANTAAVDASLKKGDYISQLCQLQLGNYLEANGYVPSGWEGTSGALVLSQMDTFGMVSKQQEMLHGCGGLYQYPRGGDAPTSSMSVEEFHQISESLINESHEIVWIPLLNFYQANSDAKTGDRILTDLKASLTAGDRVTFGVLLPDVDLGVAGAVGHYKENNDTWVLTNRILMDLIARPDMIAGHEMVIIGFNDSAVAQDSNGKIHRGLLTIRNSWGEKIGDHGDFYMSYDYFKLLVIEAQRITNLSS